MVYSLNGTAQSQRVTRVIRTFFGPLSPIHSCRYSAVLASLIPIFWASGIGSDVMKPIAAPMVGRNDYVHDSRTDSGSGFLRSDEGTVSPAWYVTAGACGVMEVRKPMLGNFVKN
jgi:cellobiose-specific phosphotransferase system component IIC